MNMKTKSAILSAAISGLVLGSTAEKVIRGSHCSVLVTRS